MKVLLATDGSPASREAEWFLSRVPFPEPVALTLATVAIVPQLGAMRREFPASVGELLDEYHAHAQALLDADARLFEGIDGEVTTKILTGHAAEALVQFAEQEHVDLTVIGARGSSPSKRFLLGSVSQKVAKHAPRSVLVTRPTGFGKDVDRPLRILICHDGSESSQRAVQQIATIAWGAAVEIVVLSMTAPFLAGEMQTYVKPDSLQDADRRAAEDALAWAVGQLRSATPNVTSELREGARAADEIIDTIEQWGADIVVLGDRGHSRIERFFLGSTSEDVLRNAACSVWIVR
ncbi:MAG: universal stress protein [Planctomycetaceae bacterium]|nr:universal stress protein [Planctomycetaceae bacterium]